MREPPWFPTFCASNKNSTSHPAAIVATGSACVAANNLALHTAPLPLNRAGLFFLGPTQIEVPFGNGLRCVGAGGAVFRLPPGSALGGELSHAVDNTAAPAAGQILPGTTWHFQAWCREPAGGGAAFNLSDGLTVVFEP